MKTVPTIKELANAGASVIWPELVKAYDYAGYSEDQHGEGRVVELYAGTRSNEWVGQLWTDDKTSTQVLYNQSKCENEDWLVKAALLLRVYRHNQSLTPSQAFDKLRRLYNTDRWSDEVMEDTGARDYRTGIDLTTVTGEPGSGVKIETKG